MESAYKLAIEILADSKNFDTGLDKASESANELADKTKAATSANSLFASGFAKVAGITGTVVAAFEGYKQIMESTEGTGDKLEQQMALLKGGLEGVFRTIATGNWESLISNITKSAAATKDLVKATEELGHIRAGDTIRRGELMEQLESARLSAADTKDPGTRKVFVEQAIEAQKQITALNVSEIQKRINDDSDYYKKLLGFSDEYFKYLSNQIPKIAKNWDLYYGKGSTAIEDLKGDIKDLTSLSSYSMGAQKKALDESIQADKLKLHTLEDYKTLQDDLSKKGQWDQFISNIGLMKSTAAEGDLALVRLTRSLTNLESKLAPTLSEMKQLNDQNFAGIKLGTKNTGDLTGGEERAGYANVKQLTKNTLIDVSGVKAAVAETNKLVDASQHAKLAIIAMNNESEKQKVIADDLTKVFQNMFSSVDGGMKAMAQSVIQSIESIVEKLLAEAAAFAIMSIIFPGSSIVTGGIGKFLGIPGLADGGLAYGPTVAQIGEYPGARNNPEVIAPLSNLMGMIGSQQAVPQKMRLALDGQGNLYGYLDYRQRHINNYR